MGHKLNSDLSFLKKKKKRKEKDSKYHVPVVVKWLASAVRLSKLFNLVKWFDDMNFLEFSIGYQGE